jgi:hypothetical protein
MADVLCLQPVYFKPTIPGFWSSDSPRSITAKKTRAVSRFMRDHGFCRLLHRVKRLSDIPRLYPPHRPPFKMG